MSAESRENLREYFSNFLLFQRSHDATIPRCLFDVYSDPGEHVNLAASHPDIHARLLVIVMHALAYCVTHE